MHLVLVARRHPEGGRIFGEALLGGAHVLERPTDAEHHRALELLGRYETTGIDFVDAVVMAMAELRRAVILTWDFLHFRASAPRTGRHWPLLLDEVDVPRR